MEKSTKTLTRLSLALQKWWSMSYNLSIVKLSHHVPQCNFANDSVSQGEIIAQKHFENNEDTKNEMTTLLQTLMNEKNLENNFNALTALHSLAKSYKDVKHSYSGENIISHTGFVNLCDKLVEKSKLLPPNHILHCLHNLAALNVPINSNIFQIFLQLLRPSINKLTLPMIISLLRLLEDNTHTNLSNALYKASKIILNEQLCTKLNTQNPKELLLCLKEAVKGNNEDVINRVIDAIWNLTKIDAHFLPSIFFTLCQISNDTPAYYNVMNRIQYELARELAKSDNASTCALEEEKIIYFITGKYKQKFKSFYNASLIHVIVNNAMTGKLSFESCVKIASFLSSIHKPDLSLLEYLALQFWENKNQMPPIPENPMVIVELIQNLAICNYKPLVWEEIQDYVMNLTELNIATHRLVNFCHSLMVLGCDCAPFLEKLFHALDDATNIHRLHKACLIRLYSAIKTFGTKYTGLIPNDSIMLAFDEFYDSYTKFESKQNFKSILATAVGGEQFLSYYLRSQVGHIADYAIVIGKDGYPIPIYKSIDHAVIYLEDLKKLSSDKVILIFAVPAAAYFDHGIEGSWSIILRSIEAYTGYDIIHINQTTLQKLNNAEQVEFIMQAIRLKCTFFQRREIYDEVKSYNAADGDDSNCKNYI